MPRNLAPASIAKDDRLLTIGRGITNAHIERAGRELEMRGPQGAIRAGDEQRSPRGLVAHGIFRVHRMWPGLPEGDNNKGVNEIALCIGANSPRATSIVDRDGGVAAQADQPVRCEM